MEMQRILNNVHMQENGCWIWKKSKTSAGYGQLTEKGKYWTTHRYVYTLVNGDIPDDLVVRHVCHNPACCNPEHLLIGTHKQNYNDSVDNHNAAQAKRRKKWEVNGVEYNTCREAVKLTSLTMHSLLKFTENCVFNIEKYRNACKVAGWKPKI